MHKRYQHNLNELKNILRENNLTITLADKNKAIVIINKAMLGQKIQTFIKENKITTLLKDPTDQFHNKSNTQFRNAKQS